MVYKASEKLQIAVQDTPLRRFEIAALAGMSPSTLSKLLRGRIKLRRFDSRAFRVARVVGVSPLEAITEVPDGERIAA